MIDSIYLTRRNLQTLLNKLDRNEEAGERVSQCTIIKSDTEHPKYPVKRATAITALEDAEYYTDREPGLILPVDEPK